MKLNNIAYSALAGAAILSLQACSPDEYSMGTSDISSEQLINGSAYTVDINQETNHVVFKASDAISANHQIYWDLTNAGGSYVQANEVSVDIPFDGDYFAFMSIGTPAGIIKSDTIKIKINKLNTNLVTDKIWTQLTGGPGKSKTWVLDWDATYFEGVFGFYNADVDFHNIDDFGKTTDNSWCWLTGFQSWMGGEELADKDYGTMTFGLENGATVAVDDKSNKVKYNGTFTVNLEKRTITLNGAELLNFSSQGARLDSRNKDLVILSITDNTLQLGITNDNGGGFETMNYITKDAKENPKLLFDDLLAASPVVSPIIEDLEKDLFTIVGDNGTYEANSVTYILNEDKAYDYYWWDGGANSWTERSVYGNDLYPKYSDDEFALTLTKKDGKITFVEEKNNIKGEVVIAGNKLSFVGEADAAGVQLPVDIPFFVTDKGAKVGINSSEIIVVKADATNNKFFFALEDTKDATGVVNQYLVANMTQKSIFGGANPEVKTVPFDADNNKYIWTEGGTLRIALWHSWSNVGLFAKGGAQKIKDGQTLTLKFKLNGINWTEAATYSWGNNTNLNDNVSWTGKVYDAIDFSKEVTVTVKNESGNAQDFSGDCLDLVIDYVGKAEGSDKWEEYSTPASGIEIISCTIQ